MNNVLVQICAVLLEACLFVSLAAGADTAIKASSPFLWAILLMGFAGFILQPLIWEILKDPFWDKEVHP